MAKSAATPGNPAPALDAPEISDLSVADQAMAVLEKAPPAEKESEAAPAGEQAGKTTVAEKPTAEEPAQEAEASSEEPATKTYKVKVNGKILDVPEQELLNGYSRTEDYKAKTAELARQREAVAAEQAAHATERQRVMQQLDVMIQHARNFDPVLAEGIQTDWAKLAKDDPAGYVAKRADFDQRRQVVDNMARERNRLFQQEMSQRQAKEAEQLVSKVPEWADDTKRQEIWGKMVPILTDKYGFTPDEIGQTMDHRAILMARDAMLYHELLASQKKAAVGVKEKIVKEVPKVAKPGASEDQDNIKPANFAALKKQALRSGTARDSARAVMAALGVPSEE